MRCPWIGGVVALALSLAACSGLSSRLETGVEVSPPHVYLAPGVQGNVSATLHCLRLVRGPRWRDLLVPRPLFAGTATACDGSNAVRWRMQNADIARVEPDTGSVVTVLGVAPGQTFLWAMAARDSTAQGAAVVTVSSGD